ncbi:preprotein translocase subunit SecG, partial [Methylobacterium sp. WL18]
GGGGGGVGGFMTGRGQANALTRATAILAALFFTTSMLLAVMSHRSAAPKSILDTGASTPAGQPAKQPTGADNLLDTLRQQQDRAPATAPAQPAVPEAPQSR